MGELMHNFYYRNYKLYINDNWMVPENDFYVDPKSKMAAILIAVYH
jgi:hypothetical protein